MKEDDRWERKDVWLGLFFFVFGLVALAYAILAVSNGLTIGIWVLGFLVGPLMMYLGGNAIWRSLRA